MKSRKGERKSKWTTEEENILREYYPKEGPKGMINRLPNRSKIAVNVHACMLGCKYEETNKYSQEEDNIIKQYFPSKGANYVANILDRRADSVRNRAVRIRIHRIDNKKASNSAYKGYHDISGSFWTRIKRSAKERAREFNITIEYAWNLYETQHRKCRLSCLPIVFSSLCQSSDGTASLDRIDSSKGYIEGNVQWVHKDINMMKQDHTDSDFIVLCKAVAACNT